MKICCVECQTKFQIDPERINNNGSMVRCSQCSYIFMVYPPDYYGSPVIQDTNIEQEILDELYEMQDEPEGGLSSIDKTAGESKVIIVDNDKQMENAKVKDLNPKDAEYAELPDLSELEKTIDWSDINDFEDSPAKSSHNYNDTQELDINRV